PSPAADRLPGSVSCRAEEKPRGAGLPSCVDGYREAAPRPGEDGFLDAAPWPGAEALREATPSPAADRLPGSVSCRAEEKPRGAGLPSCVDG
ncbi:hypothetical protein, partial [Streptomyces sp. NPDC005345]|uniref:hypothetical protein n=1 Tax=Streptomyces sp. NPDC005345 TaxID=3156877 RepID=UPI0033BB08FF